MATQQTNPAAPTRRTFRSLVCFLALVGAGLAGTGLLAPSEAFALASETPIPSWGTGPLPPQNPQGKEWQEGRVYAIARGAGRIFVGGVFTEAVPPPGSPDAPVPRAGVIALNAATGNLDTAFDARMNGDDVRALAVSPDGTTLYVGGRFTAIGGAPAKNLAALDVATGTAKPTWQAGTDAQVLSLAARGNMVYAGGKFGTVTDAAGTHSQAVIAALNASDGRLVSGWNPNLTGCANSRNGCVGPFLQAMAPSADGETLYVGGAIDHADGHPCSICALDADTGAVNTGFRPVNSREVFALSIDPGHVYAALGGGGGAGMSFDGATGRSAFEIRGDGNFQGVAEFDGVVYFGGHFADAYEFSAAGRPVPQEHFGRHKMVAVDAGTGQIEPAWDPIVNSPLGVFVVLGTPGRLDIGGDFDNVSGARQPHFAQFNVPASAPNAPSAVFAVAGDGSAVVNWTAPAGSPPTGYTVTPYAGGTAATAQSFPPDATSGAIGGLTNGVAYTFTVTAENASGSTSSVHSAPVTPRAAPGAPTAVEARPGDGTVTVTWAAPDDNGGATITRYTVTAWSGPTAVATAGVTAPATSAMVHNLANGSPYTFTATATNAGGTGPPSSPPVPATPRAVPGPPTGVDAAAGDGFAVVTWSAPADDGGAPITGYTVTASTVAGPAATTTVPATELAALVEGLANDSAYRFTVAAVNAAGAGPASAPTTAVIPSESSALLPPVAVASGYWLLDGGGRVYPFGDAAELGQPASGSLAGGAVDLDATPSSAGYWVVDGAGRVQAFGDARHFGNAGPAALPSGERVTSLSGTPTGAGYWLFTNRGRIFTFGDALPLGDLSGRTLNGPVLDSIATPSGQGYYMVASDGGIFAFGDARFTGSMGNRQLNAPVRSAVPDPDGTGYWLVASDGGVFAFDAPFRGSAGALALNGPITGMVTFGHGYLLVGADGGVFNYSDLPFSGSLGNRRPATPVVAVAAIS